MLIGGVESAKKSRQASRHLVAVVDEHVRDGKIRAKGLKWCVVERAAKEKAILVHLQMSLQD
jgi:hypothetical protein